MPILPFANSFSPYTVKEWNKLNLEIHNVELYSIFKNFLLKFIRTIPNSLFGVANIYGIEQLTRLHAGLIHLREHKFRHNFQNTINPLCSCSLEIELTSHFFLRCQNFITPRTNLMNELCKLDSSILNLDEISLTKFLLYGDSKFKNKVNKKILLASKNFIFSTKRFEGQLIRHFSQVYVCLQFFFVWVYFTLYAPIFYASLHGDSKVMRSCFSL